jgi:SAM-dependent methyltransferase
MTHASDPFLALMPQAGHILDAGCGSGRDTAEFVRRGFRVTAFDGSAALATRAAERTGLPVLHLRFDEVTWNEQFDGVWACASLLHLPTPELRDALVRLVTALKPAGVLFASIKVGSHEGERDGRWFNDTTPEGFGAVVRDISPRLEVVRIWETDDARPDRAGTRWVNALARRA